MSGVVALDPCRGTESAVAQLRREALSAVVRQQQLREKLAAIRTQACAIERQAARALAGGDGLLGRQILARGIYTLKTRDLLEEELVATSDHVCQLLTTMVRAENQSWRAKV